MMRTTSKFVKSVAVLSALLPFCGSALGAGSIVYDNSTTDLNQTYIAPNGTQFGDEITLAGADRTITGFKFEYFLSAGASGNETAQLFFYRNDGPAVSRVVNGDTLSIPSPGTVLYTSPVLSLQGGFQTAEADGLSINVPDNFTWAIAFNGIDGAESAGLRLYDPVTTGSSFADFWQNNAGTWNTYLLNNGNTPANFAARVTAVPEPATVAYALLAGLGCLGYLGLKRRSS